MEATAPDSSKARGTLPDPITMAFKFAILYPKFLYRDQPVHAWLGINGVLQDVISWPNLRPSIEQYTDPVEVQRLEMGMLGALIKEEPHYELLGLFCLDIPGFEAAWDQIGERLQVQILLHWKAILEAASTYQQDEGLSPISLRRMALISQLQAELDRRTQGQSDEVKQWVRLGIRITLDVLAGETPESPGYQVIPLDGPDDRKPDLHHHFGDMFESVALPVESIDGNQAN